jgi:hypothetical protein
VIEKAKTSKREKIEHDDFFASEGIHRDDDAEDEVTKILQHDYV